ncbi:putative transcription factor FAR family [Helianthus annuus]|nr:putative transcription factor FAR family [Helianthus annuus]
MDLEVQLQEDAQGDASETNLINDIDASGRVVINSGSDVETEKKDDDEIEKRNYVEIKKSNDIDMDFGFEKEENNDVMGKVFDTPNDAYNFYNRYAFLHGFGIRIHTAFKNKTTNEPYRRLYVCNKQGFKDLKSKGSIGDVKKRRRNLITGCEAFLRISKSKDGKWSVDKFSDSHNHELTVTPTKVMKHRSHGKFHRSLTCKAILSELDQSGLKPCQIKKVVNTMKGPYENDVTSKQCSDILADQRRQYKGKEFYGLIKHFQDKLLKDQNLYFVVDLFDDGSPRNIFWADGRSRDSYIKFGDVVVFDVTYMTNKFKMPFAPFVGVNHHGQSILFGGALLENEKQDTFEWLFQNFLKCMFDKYPSAIITDQDKAICNAIKIVFPKTRHRYCSWHIKKHEIEHLRPLKVRYSDFEELHKQWVKSNTIEEFETRWEFLCGKYNFETGSWIPEMYNQRKYWAKAFLKDCFFVGMTSSRRSESIHSFFDGYVNSKTMLNEFVRQYDKAVETRRAAEEDEDFKTMNSKPILSSVSLIEAKASSRYTRKLFDVFKKEWTEATFNLTHEKISKSSEEISYKLDNCTIGIEDMNSENEVSALTLWCVQSNFRKATEQARDSPSEIKKLNTILLRFSEEQNIRKKSKQNETTSLDSNVGSSQVNMMPQITVRDPLVNTNTKGRPKSATRIKSSLEAPKKRSCSYCNKVGHYISSCPQKKADESRVEREK